VRSDESMNAVVVVASEGDRNHGAFVGVRPGA
jgi:hypothetical protein